MADSWNDPARELSSGEDMMEEAVYCVTCGTIYVKSRFRDCPSCSNRDEITALQSRVEDLEDRVADQGDLEDIHRALDDIVSDLGELQQETRATRQVMEEIHQRDE